MLTSKVPQGLQNNPYCSSRLLWVEGLAGGVAHKTAFHVSSTPRPRYYSQLPSASGRTSQPSQPCRMITEPHTLEGSDTSSRYKKRCSPFLFPEIKQLGVSGVDIHIPEGFECICDTVGEYQKGLLKTDGANPFAVNRFCNCPVSPILRLCVVITLWRWSSQSCRLFSLSSTSVPSGRWGAVRTRRPRRIPQ